MVGAIFFIDKKDNELIKLFYTCYYKYDSSLRLLRRSERQKLCEIIYASPNYSLDKGELEEIIKQKGVDAFINESCNLDFKEADVPIEKINLYLPQDMKFFLERQAKEQKRSISSLLRKMIREY